MAVSKYSCKYFLYVVAVCVLMSLSEKHFDTKDKRPVAITHYPSLCSLHIKKFYLELMNTLLEFEARVMVIYLTY